MREAFNLTEAQALAVDALVSASGISAKDIHVVKGGTPADGALRDDVVEGRFPITPRRSRASSGRSAPG
jgi:hypothetical protein